jgi:2-amino-4-hydroxy-6-hydroxymethyldihydropteridine diphosphokinase
MAQVYVSIGSNIDREEHICSALRRLSERFGTLELSTVYESKAVGFEGGNFFNLVASFTTRSSPYEIVDELHRIEEAHGRRREGPRLASRTLDIDLLLYDDLILNDAGLVIPREEITHQAFVLKPLAQLAGERRHPVTRQTFAEMWHTFAGDEQAVWPVEFSC